MTNIIMDTDEPKGKQQPKEEQPKEETKYIKPTPKKSTTYTDIYLRVRRGMFICLGKKTI